MKTAEETYNKIAADMAAESGAVIGKMFGMPSLFINGNAFAGYFQESLILKLTGEAHTKALAEPGAKLFDPGMGRPMKEWVHVPFSSAKKWPKLAEESLGYVSTLKKKK